tara:strand:+ start:2197 stop:2532 length:336 start_codon:yes stop_codon:yes gene_type:complete
MKKIRLMELAGLISEQNQKASDLEAFLTDGGFELVPFGDKGEMDLSLKGKQGSVWDAATAGWKRDGKDYVNVYLAKDADGEEMYDMIEDSGNYDVMGTTHTSNWVSMTIAV